MFDRIGLVQVDSVNVLARSQDLVLFARLGPHPASLIPDASAAGELFEYWVHEASHVPATLHPLLRWKMRREHRWAAVRELAAKRPGWIDEVLARLTIDGPLTAGDFQARVGPRGTWWQWDDAKIALEHLFWEGRIVGRRRARDFARVYDLAERCLPPEILALPTPSDDDARRELVARAARHLGVATTADLADYHRLPRADVKRHTTELVEAGRLVPVRVEGWQQPAFLDPGAAVPRRSTARALLSPFDSLVFDRARTERLFGFRYRIEIYVPAPQRVYGYYVLPFLLGEDLVARLDLKADRQAGSLLVHAAYAEPGADGGEVAAAAAAELALMASWLGLGSVTVGGRGDLAGPLAAAVTTLPGGITGA
jgi:uncharacterized protein YcaQ